MRVPSHALLSFRRPLDVSLLIAVTGWPLVLLLASTLAIGCARSHPDTGAIPQPNPQPTVATNVKDRVHQMRDLTDQVTRVVSTLPAPDDATQRTTMRDAFDLFSRALPLLMGPDADGQFRLQQRIIADARDRLAKDGPTLAAEPTIDAGLRAVFNALVRISQESFYTSPTITAAISDLHDKVDALDSVRGPMHGLAVAKAAQQSAAVMNDMTRIYSARLDHRTPEPPVPNPKRESEQPAPTNAK